MICCQVATLVKKRVPDEKDIWLNLLTLQLIIRPRCSVSVHTLQWLQDAKVGAIMGSMEGGRE